MAIIDELMKLKDEEYAKFQLNLTPGLTKEQIIGVRVPKIRELAKDLMKNRPEEAKEFMNSLPHTYLEENILHGALFTFMKDYDECIVCVDQFLPYIDNWAVCDTAKPKVFAKNKDKLIVKIREWSKSKHTYVCRFGIEMLMNHFLDGDFKPEYLDIPASVVSEEYYVNMMIAWYFATALAKQWDATLPYIEEKRMGKWVHNKTIQKARESFRITPEQKEYLKTLKC